MDALSGVRIVDASWVLAGPYATELLAFLGAEVIKIESGKRIDLLRRVATALGWWEEEDVEKSAQFNTINLNKLGITLDLSEPQGIDLVKRLVCISDVFVENFSPGVADRLGLGYEALRGIKPELIMLSLSASGTSGPESGYLGYAALFHALSGLAHLTGYADGPPALVRAPIDAMAGSFAALAILAALNYRQCTGEGQFIDLSAREATSCLVGDSLMDYTMNQRVQSRNGNRDEVMAPHNCYRCHGEDKWVSIAIVTDEEWESLCEAMGNPAWTKEERFCDTIGRWQNQEELDRLIEEWTRGHTHYQVMQMLQEKGIAAVPSFDAQELFSDPHLQERGFAIETEHPRLGRQVVSAPPWKLSATSPQAARPAPLLGQHNQYVFAELLGMSQHEITRLEDEGIIC